MRCQKTILDVRRTQGGGLAAFRVQCTGALDAENFCPHCCGVKGRRRGNPLLRIDRLCAAVIGLEQSAQHAARWARQRQRLAEQRQETSAIDFRAIAERIETGLRGLQELSA